MTVRVSELDASEIVLLDVFKDRDFLVLEPVSPLVNLLKRVDAKTEVNVRESMVLVIQHQQIPANRGVSYTRVLQLILDP